MSVQSATCGGGAHILTTAFNVGCTVFREEGTPSRFYKWPERLSHTLCCGSGEVMANYLYPGMYYDVRLVQRLKWYFLHWDFSFLDKTQPQAVTVCEYSVLHKFYKQWFYTHVFFHGVLFGFALIVFSQGIICCVWRFWLKRPLAMWSDDYDAAMISCFHMGLLGVNGFAAMVAAGHGSLLSYSSDSFACAMSLYSYLTVLSIFCVVFEHLAYEDRLLLGKTLHMALHRILKRSDWRWQPVWAQLAAGICMYMYATGVETSPGQLEQGAAQAIPIVVLAIFWSGGHTMVYVVLVAEILFIEFLRVTGILGKLRSIGILRPSKFSTNNPTVSLTQIATTTVTNPNPVSATTAAHPNPAPISTSTATIPNPNPTTSPVITSPAATTP